MYEITEILMNQKKRNEVTVDFSLTGTLEAIIRGYYVEGEGGVNPDRWLRVYYSPLADPEKTIISTFKFPESLVAYVSLDDQIAIVKNEILNKFKVDTDGYGLSYYSTESFDIEEYFYSSKEQLPSDFREIVWVDDDFMNNDEINFDFEKFEIIDSGVKYLSPKKFSINQLMNCVYAPYRK